MATNEVTVHEGSELDAPRLPMQAVADWEEFLTLMRHKKEEANIPTPSAFRKKRKGRGGDVWHYVDIHPMLHALKEVHPCFRFVPVFSKLFGEEAVAQVRLQIIELGIVVQEYIGTGSCPCHTFKSGQHIGEVISYGDALSGAMTLAKKKAMHYTGVFGDMYGDDANEFVLVPDEELRRLMDYAESQHSVGRISDDVLVKTMEALTGEVSVKRFDQIEEYLQELVQGRMDGTETDSGSS